MNADGTGARIAGKAQARRGGTPPVDGDDDWLPVS
jgi:hypothetical protein